MNILNEFFEKVYVITSFETKDRYSHIVNYKEKYNLDFELVIAPNKINFKNFYINNDYEFDENWNGSVNRAEDQSLVSANENIFLKSKLLNLKSFCILEDDVVFSVDYEKKLKNIMYYVPSNWDILNLGYHKHTCLEHEPLIRPLHQKIGTHMVVYKDTVIDEFLKCVRMNTFPIDWFLNQYVYRKFNSYTTDRQIFNAASYRVYEQDKDANYKKFKSGID